MFCMKCGKPLEGDLTICPECAGKEVAAQPAETPVTTLEITPPVEALPEITPPVTPAPALELNLEAEAPQPKKPMDPKKKKKIALISAAAALLVAIVVGIIGFTSLNWGRKIEFFWVKLTKNDRQAALWVEKQSLNERTNMVNVLSSAYGSMKTGYTPGNGNEMSISMEMGKGLEGLLNLAAIQSPELKDFVEAFKKMEISSTGAYDGDLFSTKMSLALGNTKILTIQTIFDLMRGEEYVGISSPDGVQDEYYVYDIPYTELLTTQFFQAVAEDLPSQQQFNQLLDKYYLLVIKNIDNIKESTKKITVDGVTQKFTVYTYRVDEEGAVKIALAVLREAENDKTLRSMAETVCENYSDIYGYRIDADDLFDQISDAIEELEEYEADDEEEIILKTYVDSAGFISGRSLSSSEGEEAFSYITTVEGRKAATELKIGEGRDSITFIGKGKAKGGKLNGSYTLKVQKQSIANVDLKGFNYRTGYGTVRITPAKSFQRQLENSIDSSIVDLLGGLELALEVSLQQHKTGISLILNDEAMFTLTASMKPTKATPIDEPEDTTDDLEEWLDDVDLEPIIENLEKAGIPKALLRALEYVDLSDLIRQLDPYYGYGQVYRY